MPGTKLVSTVSYSMFDLMEYMLKIVYYILWISVLSKVLQHPEIFIR